MVLALAALISACQAADETEGGEGLRATLPLAGATLVEHQVRLAAAAGAAPIVILVERLPATLTAAVDRLRQDGLRVEMARGLADAVDRIHPDEALLVIADGCVAAGEIVARMADAPVPAVLTVPDDPDRAAFERIDAAARWGGLLLIDGARLRRTAAMLGEWDLQSTLLRRAVQEDAARIGAFDDGDAPLLIADRATMLAPLERGLIGAARAPGNDWPSRFVFPPIVDLAALPLLRRGVEPRWLVAGAVALALLAVPFALFGWRWTALALLLVPGPVVALADRLAGVRLIGTHRPRWADAGRLGAAAAAILLLGGDLAATQGWGCWLLAGVVPVVMAALARERRMLADVSEAPLPVWLASPDALAWLVLPVAAVGGWLGAIAAAAAYAVGSFAFVQHRLMRVLGADGV